MTIMNVNYMKALDVLNGSTVLSRDRRREDAPAVPFDTMTVQRDGKKFRGVRTCYGISNRMHTRLARLATKVEVLYGRFIYLFEAK